MMTPMLDLSTQSVSVEYQLDVSHLGRIRIRDDVFGVAIIIRDMRIVDFSDGLIPRCVQGRKSSFLDCLEEYETLR
ncbi:hypothetical protein Ddye_005926 [Dipteronia dyeriana]|uniref:Uncharacterized protein n=1 Tax=Dipteronia dyeriana TaxID=168575 RepID=A0AAD9XI29_9ROSI|nr:hypothetical protein Ddye_005926 [Dipteronia dyeriana]